MQKTAEIRLILIRMITVGATIGRPRAFDERPYKQISAEILFSLPLFVKIRFTVKEMSKGACRALLL